MKLNNILVASTALCLSLSVQANTNFDKELVELPKKKVASLKIDKPDFGTYKVEKQLRLVPSSIVSGEHVVSQIGDMAVIKADISSEVVTKGTLVRNIFTNNLSTLSGNIKVLLKDDVSAHSVASTLGMRVISVFAGTQIAVLAISEGQDILALSEQLRSADLVKEARIEVQETIYSAQ
ncbi:hypothetical protein HH219_03245 [Pseudoalteromonas sp. NEC-BIFX-2020_015]|uniref:hypothetical protein n=1 Tax=Pseudoalteromonas sp. NEC-BIFX-2020_015 TaxID=2729544 RepID=UPI00146151D4|nr:hypothetical protein [Pseudoalteromonas sp. NEC-BIFX-2020_015]NMR24573.1 hypothetical protein [Pseudoalteromonas sp. NEC-BIFX-2020_015]